MRYVPTRASSRAPCSPSRSVPNSAEERAVTPGGWSLATKLRAAEGFVAGDCYETGLIDQATMYIVVIDVTGHGAKAALSALKAKAQLRSALRTGALARRRARMAGPVSTTTTPTMTS